MISTQELAVELGVSEDDVLTFVEELVYLDGEDAVIASVAETGAHYGTYPIVVTTLTDQAANDVRRAVAATAADPNAH